MDNAMMAFKCRGLVSELSEIDADYDTMSILDDAMETLEMVGIECEEMERKRAKTERIGNTLMLIGVGILLVCGSGVDVPDPTANYIGCGVGAAIALIGLIARK